MAERLSNDITVSVQQLKDERDLWELRAKSYKDAFDTQSKQLREAIDLCTAMQIELANERSVSHHCQCRTASSSDRSGEETASVRSVPKSNSSHTLVKEMSAVAVEWQSTPATQASFGHVEQLVMRKDLVNARKEIDRMLPGSLTAEARVEALLLKSAICRALGPEWLLEGLAQCSEALALCDSLSGLEFLLPKIQYHRDLCHSQLRDLRQTRTAITAVGTTDSLHGHATKYWKSCEDDLEDNNTARRRSAFEERRTITEGFLDQLKEDDASVSLIIEPDSPV